MRTLHALAALASVVTLQPACGQKTVRVQMGPMTANEADVRTPKTNLPGQNQPGTDAPPSGSQDSPTPPATNPEEPRSVPIAKGFLHTRGNQILDSEGHAVRLAGVSWFGMESSNLAPHGLWSRSYKSMMDQMKSLGFNTIRIPYCDEAFEPGKIPNGVDANSNPDLQGLSALEILDKIVAYAGDIGLRILLDHHRSDAGTGALGNDVWHSAARPESTWIANWTMLAKRYKDKPAVVGADLHNEPHGVATWGGGDPQTDWAAAAERAGNAILAENPNWLIVVEGVERVDGGTYWWGGNLRSARTRPIRLTVKDRLVYSPHEYPASVFHQTWFDAETFPRNLPAVWDGAFGYLFRENLAPLLIGEFGTRLSEELDRKWLDAFVEYLKGDLDGDGNSDLAAGQTGPSWIWWSWNPNSGDTGGILKDDWTSVNDEKMQKLRPILK